MSVRYQDSPRTPWAVLHNGGDIDTCADATLFANKDTDIRGFGSTINCIKTDFMVFLIYESVRIISRIYSRMIYKLHKFNLFIVLTH